LFTVLGLLGWLLLLLWIATDHKAAATNFNLLWAFPLHLFAAMALLRKVPSKRVMNYFTLVIVLTSLLLGFWALLPQQLNPFLLPVVFIILMRALVIRHALIFEL
jgi:hypothetical protein